MNERAVRTIQVYSTATNLYNMSMDGCQNISYYQSLSYNFIILSRRIYFNYVLGVLSLRRKTVLFEMQMYSQNAVYCIGLQGNFRRFIQSLSDYSETSFKNDLQQFLMVCQHMSSDLKYFR